LYALEDPFKLAPPEAIGTIELLIAERQVCTADGSYGKEAVQ